MAYPDQIVDKLTAGIPLDVELARDEVKKMRDETQGLRDYTQNIHDQTGTIRDQALGYRDEARQFAINASNSAKKAEAYVTSRPGIHFGPTEPPSPTPGSVWFKTQTQDSRTITSILRYDLEAGGGLYPSTTTYPGNDIYPAQRGAWVEYNIANTLIHQ